MERPPSQLENVRPSGLKPPSRLPAAANGRTLLETSQSDLNSKSADVGNMMPPPARSISGSKHKISGRESCETHIYTAFIPNSNFAVPEPPTKRKTLVERAGEPANPLRSHMPQPHSKPTLARSESTTAQVGSRPPSSSSMLTHSYRNTSTASTISSVSSIRPSSRQVGTRQIGARPPSVAETRPGLEDQNDETEAGVMGKRKGTPPVLSFRPHLAPITMRKTRAGSPQQQQSTADVHMRIRSQHSGQSCIRASSSSASSSAANGDGNPAARSCSAGSDGPANSTQDHTQQQEEPRNTSLCTQFADLSLTPKERKTSGPKPKHRPSLSRITETEERAISPSKIPKFSCTPSLRHAQSAQILRTPSPLKHKSSAASGLRTPASSVRRAAPGSVRGASDELPIFLTKEKLTSFPAWDTKGRLEDMEQMYVQLRSQFASAADSKLALEESLGLYKSQGMA